MVVLIVFIFILSLYYKMARTDEDISDWEVYTDESIRKSGWINKKTGQFTFKHPNYIACCERCEKDIIRSDDCFIKGSEDGDITYCKNCYDENVWFNKKLEEMMFKMELEEANKSKNNYRQKRKQKRKKRD